ncbi:hypothetical protein JWJ90_20195 [Desulfobulbus rhabdoformis]|uniref:hypothetical protein n=1 Tax=Desulfobulbus rhabdoformis TaxID=34032 RepID=UPI0019634FAD|nr:hypothetical protein [Desulfobulbus rhabdoformis]MBM9616591.1 hypothetical protein [Desulfobulbus rhabdoformis]
MAGSIDPIRILSALSAFCSLVFLLVRTMKELREGLETLGLGQKESPSLFYELCFWGIVSALIGGFIWGLFWEQSIGGAGREPHGIWAILWAFVTNLPGLLVLVALNRKYHFLLWKERLLPCAAWLSGIVIGAWVFYDLPLAGFNGFREFFLNNSFDLAELWLVIIWSALVAIPAFFFFAVSKRSRNNTPFSLTVFWAGVVRPSGLTVLVTTLVVGAFMIVYPDQSQLSQARGVLAGLFLRVMLFINLFLVLSPSE